MAATDEEVLVATQGWLTELRTSTEYFELENIVKISLCGFYFSI